MNNSKIRKDVEQLILMLAMACIIAALLLGIALYARGTGLPPQNQLHFRELNTGAPISYQPQHSIAESSLPDWFLIRSVYLTWWTESVRNREGI